MGDPGPLLSLVIPVRGDAFQLTQLGVACSTALPGVEWIVVVDGDPGGSVTSALAPLRDRPDVKVVKQERRGPGVARNAGLSHALGATVAFLDSDDEADVSAFIRLASDMSRHRALVGVLGYEMVRDGEANSRLEGQIPAAGWQDPWPLLRRRAGVWRFAFERDFLLREGVTFPDQSYAEDLVFLATVLASGKPAWGVPACGYTYRIHSDAALTQQRPSALDVAATLGTLDSALESARSPEQRRVLQSWRARIWLRLRRSPITGDLQPLPRAELLKGLAWSVAWAACNPSHLASFVRSKVDQRAGRRKR